MINGACIICGRNQANGGGFFFFFFFPLFLFEKDVSLYTPWLAYPIDLYSVLITRPLFHDQPPSHLPFFSIPFSKPCVSSSPTTPPPPAALKPLSKYSERFARLADILVKSQHCTFVFVFFFFWLSISAIGDI